MSVLLFELHRGEIAEGGMQTLAIVPNLNVFKDGGACLGMCDELVGDTFRFESAKETFCHRIVVAVSDSAHAGLDVAVCQSVLVGSTGILAALIRMMKQRGIWLAGVQGHMQGGFHESCVHVCGHSPAHHFAGKQIQNNRKV
jgi:hypothetical protein